MMTSKNLSATTSKGNDDQSRSLPLFISACVSVKSDRSDYISIFDSKADINNLKPCRSDPAKLKTAAKKLKEAGFLVTSISTSTINLVALRRTFEHTFPISFRLSEDTHNVLAVPKDSPSEEPKSLIPVPEASLLPELDYLFFEPANHHTGFLTRKDNKNDKRTPTDVYLDEIPKLLRVPDGCILTGEGVTIAVVDSGLYDFHSCFNGRGFANDSFVKTIQDTIAAEISSIKNTSDKLLKTEGRISTEDFINLLTEFFHQTFQEELNNSNCNFGERLKGADSTDSITSLANDLVSEKSRQLNALKGNVEDVTDGHGTAVTANVLAVSRSATVTSYKAIFDSSKLGGVFKSFNNGLSRDAVKKAAKDGANIVNCSFGASTEDDKVIDSALKVWTSEVQGYSKVLFLFPSGNSDDDELLAQAHLNLPNVIVVGGAYWKNMPEVLEPKQLDEKKLAAANGAVGHPDQHNLRAIPDICGLVANDDEGMIWCPYIDEDDSFSDKFWDRMTGTSFATPQLSGVCALIKQSWKDATPRDIKTIVLETASPLPEGKAFNPLSVKDGYTLWSDDHKAGFVHAGRALDLAEFCSVVALAQKIKPDANSCIAATLIKNVKNLPRATATASGRKLVLANGEMTLDFAYALESFNVNKSAGKMKDE